MQDIPALLLYLAILISTLCLTGLRRARPARTAAIVRWTGVSLSVLVAVVALVPAFLAARLDGSSPPGLLEFLAGYWLPLLLLFGVVAALWMKK